MPTNTPTASPKVSSTIGLKNVVLAELLTDTETGHTYGDLQLVAGAIEASVTPDNADPDIMYADDIEEIIFANVVDDNGVLIRTAQDKPPYFAVGFKSEKSDGKYRYVWLYKVRAKPLTENFATKEGKTINRQTPEVEFTAIKRTHDGRYQAVADEGENGFTAEQAATFLTSVYEPSFTP